MDYKIGDKIVHWTYGLGTVVAIDQKDIDGVTQEYYVVEVELLKFGFLSMRPIEVRFASQRRAFNLMCFSISCEHPGNGCRTINTSGKLNSENECKKVH